MAIDASGLILSRKCEKPCRIGTANPAIYLGGSSVQFESPDGQVVLKFNSVRSDNAKFARDLVDWFAEPHGATFPRLGYYNFGCWMTALVFLPLGIPILEALSFLVLIGLFIFGEPFAQTGLFSNLSLLGVAALSVALSFLVGWGLFALNRSIARSGLRPVFLRGIGCLTTTLPIYGLLAMLVVTHFDIEIEKDGEFGEFFGSVESWFKQDARHGPFTYKKTGNEIMIVRYSPDGASTVEIPKKIRGKPVTQIGYKVFFECRELRSVTIPEGVTVIGKQSFQGCHLEEVDLPQSIRTIEPFAFDRCESLRTVRIRGRVTEISRSCFKGCTSLVEVELPDSVTHIGYDAFFGSTALRNIRFPNRLESIDEKGFMRSGLVEVELPDSVSTLGDKAFHESAALKKVQLPAGLTKIPYKAFSRCGLEQITIPPSVREIGQDAFKEYESLTEVDLPEQLSVIRNYSFLGCSSLVSIDLPAGLTEIGDRAFLNCAALENINVPLGLKKVGYEAFGGTKLPPATLQNFAR